MFTVFTDRNGKAWTHSVKALQIIWNHFPQLYVDLMYLTKICNLPHLATPPIPFMSMTLWVIYPKQGMSELISSESRNFALNPKEGLKIQPFKNAHTPEAMADRELDKLARYMLHIANVADFRILSHKVRDRLLWS